MGERPLLEERKERVLKTIALEKTDRTPVVLEYAGFAARAAGVPLTDFISSPLRATEVMIEAWERVGGADAMEYPTYSPGTLSTIWLSKIALSGKELPPDEPWQVQEIELMVQEDYDKIVEKGWMDFYYNFLEGRIQEGFFQQLMEFLQDSAKALRMWQQKEVPILVSGIITTPYEIFCGGRTMQQFVLDLYRIPDKVEKAMEAAVPHLAGQAIELTKQFGLPAMWIGGWRSASEFLSRPLWERFVWPYLERLALEVLEAGIIVIFHLDSNWTRDLEFFKSFPRGRCVLSLDSKTDIFRAKEVVGETACIMGDVPPALLSHGTPDEVHKYCRRLIEGLGPEGFILHSGCDVPMDAKLENVQAMVAAATGK